MLESRASGFLHHASWLKFARVSGHLVGPLICLSEEWLDKIVWINTLVKAWQKPVVHRWGHTSQVTEGEKLPGGRESKSGGNFLKLED